MSSSSTHRSVRWAAGERELEGVASLMSCASVPSIEEGGEVLFIVSAM